MKVLKQFSLIKKNIDYVDRKAHLNIIGNYLKLFDSVDTCL